MGVREYDFQVPYGVVKAKEMTIQQIEEKPVHSFFVNAGIYVLDHKTINSIPPDTYLDMPVLFQELIDKKQETIIFPIREYWLDIGRVEDFHKANGEYGKNFFDT